MLVFDLIDVNFNCLVDTVNGYSERIQPWPVVSRICNSMSMPM